MKPLCQNTRDAKKTLPLPILQHGQEEEGEQAPQRVLHIVLRFAVAARVQPERLDAGREVLKGEDPRVARGGRDRGARVRSSHHFSHRNGRLMLTNYNHKPAVKCFH